MDRCQSTNVYKHKETAPVLYVIPVSSVMGLLPLVPVGKRGTILLDMRENQLIFSGLSVIKQRTAMTVVSGGTSTAGPWDGKPNNSAINNETSKRTFCNF